MTGVKLWFDGNRLIDSEVFVSKEYQGKHIARYGNEEEFPQCWYNRIGLRKDNELIIMNGNIEKVLRKIKL